MHFAGNPAAVCLLPSPPPAKPSTDEWMRMVASEMNQSETAFLWELKGIEEKTGTLHQVHQAQEQIGGRGDSMVSTGKKTKNRQFHLRWWTPTQEERLCGHATLASAHTLWSNGVVPPECTISFTTLSGVLTAALHPQGWIELNFPREDPKEVALPSGVLRAMGLAPSALVWCGRNRLDLFLLITGGAGAVERVRPNMKELAALLPKTRCVVVTSSDYDLTSSPLPPSSLLHLSSSSSSSVATATPSTKRSKHIHDFVSRVFAPHDGMFRLM